MNAQSGKFKLLQLLNKDFKVREWKAQHLTESATRGESATCRESVTYRQRNANSFTKAGLKICSSPARQLLIEHQPKPLIAHCLKIVMIALNFVTKRRANKVALHIENCKYQASEKNYTKSISVSRIFKSCTFLLFSKSGQHKKYQLFFRRCKCDQ